MHLLYLLTHGQTTLHCSINLLCNWRWRWLLHV